ncbi:hypothetical protein KQX54_007678 [Cotesia glomerata]|uniref:Uncharacterized protein n=1 Tax=Cotesia glomerata TaxID=32391 RepID=A0AAV7IQS4_COTGL|nr:hypothetical protein KQX54_007678 [Cotesia glomerata]
MYISGMWDPRELVLAPELTNPDYCGPAQWCARAGVQTRDDTIVFEDKECAVNVPWLITETLCAHRL